MLFSILVWYGLGVLGSIMVALGTSLDGDGIDHKDWLVLAFFAIAGPFWFFIGIPFFFMWTDSLFGDKK